jgi:outer membrane protein assembly factor BamD
MLSFAPWRIVVARNLRGIFVSVLLALAVGACASDDDVAYVEQPVERLYNQAMDSLLNGDFFEAARGFDEVERQHPYSIWATRAQVMAAYSYYQNNSYDEAVIGARRFVDLHPGHRDAPYAYYLMAICFYEQISDVGRDQKMTQLALQSLDEVVKRFPETDYARDAGLKIDLARDHLAGKEMSIGRYYLVRGQLVAAINRFRSVVGRYQTTSHIPEALHRLTEAYLLIGVPHEAQAAAAVLGYNYPGSDWYADSYVLLEGEGLTPAESERSWISRMFSSVF